jgi:hypothetical protein
MRSERESRVGGWARSPAVLLAATLVVLGPSQGVQAQAPVPEAQAPVPDEAVGARESLAFEHLNFSVVMRACSIGAVCTASWRVDSSGHVSHRDGSRLFEGTLPSDNLAALATMAVSADMLSEIRRPEPCPDRTKVFSDLEVGMVPGLVVTTHTGDCTAQRLGTLTAEVRRLAHALFPASRSSDDVLPQIPKDPPVIGRRGGARPSRGQRHLPVVAKVALATSR